MKKLSVVLVGVSLLFTIVESSFAAGEKRKLSGSYVWDARDYEGDLVAVFVPKGERAWKVSFRFHFRGKLHVYTGTATGSLESGELEGEVKTGDKRRSFAFRGEFEDGTFRGRHVETTAGQRIATGTLTLQ